MHNRPIFWPSPKHITSTYLQYQFAVPGLLFSLPLPTRTGGELDQKQYCTAKTGLITMGEDADTSRFEDMLGVVGTATRRGRLARMA